MLGSWPQWDFSSFLPVCFKAFQAPHPWAGRSLLLQLDAGYFCGLTTSFEQHAKFYVLQLCHLDLLEECSCLVDGDAAGNEGPRALVGMALAVAASASSLVCERTDPRL